MRSLLFAALMASAAAPAHAASIEKVTSGTVPDGSILQVSCEDCKASPPSRMGYQVPKLSGVASMKIVNTDGKPEVVRVDKFMGGSPVMTMSKTQAPLIEEMSAIETKAHEAKIAARNAELQTIDAKVAGRLPPDERGMTAIAGIDREATTAALSGAQANAFDPNSLTLRLR
ncbi:MAG TPA: plant virulence effector HPE1-like domain-containing protein [Ensifer sp.]|nr:plant virulence effector HPE1-like domain-containing protein [Ensifer sp.]